MKKLYTILTAILFTGTVLAQPVLNAPNFPPAGTVITNHEVNATPVMEGNAGANQTWDFSAYPGTGTTSTSEYVDPATTPFASSFTSANHATMSPTTAGNTGYGYMYATSTYTDLIGVGVESTTGPDIVYSYSNAERVGSYPLNYTGSYSDNFSALASYVNGGFTINQYRTGSMTFTYDGYGTLITPGGTYSNVIRGKLTQNILDSIVIVGFPTATTSTTHSVSYGWVSPTGYDSYYYIVYDTTTGGAGSSTNKTVAYNTSTVGINEITPSYKPIEVYPNPAVNNSMIHLVADDLKRGNTKFVAVDMQGREVKSIDFYLMPGNHKTVDIDAADLATGVYSVRLVQADAIYISRFVKQ